MMIYCLILLVTYMKISVILTTYNSEKYIKQCIDSILNQTFVDYEIIIIDDGSNDKTLKIIKENYPDLYIIKNNHVGVAKCRNIALTKATGKYICILDSDDYFESNMLEIMYNKLEQYNADIAISSAYKFDDVTGEEVELKYMLNKSLYQDLECFSPYQLKDKIFQLTVANAWAKMFKRELIINNNIQFQDLKNSNDVLFTFSAIIKAQTIVPIDIPLVHYRSNNKKSIQGIKSKYPVEFIAAYSELQNYLISEGIYDNYKESFIKMIINIFVWNIYTVDLEGKKIIIEKLKSKYYNYFNIDEVFDKDEKYILLRNMVK